MSAGIASTSDLKRAADHISATEVGPGVWAHYDDGMRRWYTVTGEQLASLVGYLDDEDEQVSSDAYSHWCAGTTAAEMPEAWTPGDTYPPGVRP